MDEAKARSCVIGQSIGAPLKSESQLLLLLPPPFFPNSSTLCYIALLVPIMCKYHFTCWISHLVSWGKQMEELGQA